MTGAAAVSRFLSTTPGEPVIPNVQANAIIPAASVHTELVETMAQAAYESTRLPGSQRPPWASVTPGWQSACRQEVLAGLTAAAKAGWQMVRRG